MKTAKPVNSSPTGCPSSNCFELLTVQIKSLEERMEGLRNHVMDLLDSYGERLKIQSDTLMDIHTILNARVDAIHALYGDNNLCMKATSRAEARRVPQKLQAHDKRADIRLLPSTTGDLETST